MGKRFESAKKLNEKAGGFVKLTSAAKRLRPRYESRRGRPIVSDAQTKTILKAADEAGFNLRESSVAKAFANLGVQLRLKYNPKFSKPIDATISELPDTDAYFHLHNYRFATPFLAKNFVTKLNEKEAKALNKLRKSEKNLEEGDQNLNAVELVLLDKIRRNKKLKSVGEVAAVGTVIGGTLYHYDFMDTSSLQNLYHGIVNRLNSISITQNASGQAPMGQGTGFEQPSGGGSPPMGGGTEFKGPSAFDKTKTVTKSLPGYAKASALGGIITGGLRSLFKRKKRMTVKLKKGEKEVTLSGSPNKIIYDTIKDHGIENLFVEPPKADKKNFNEWVSLMNKHFQTPGVFPKISVIKPKKGDLTLQVASGLMSKKEESAFNGEHESHEQVKDAEKVLSESLNEAMNSGIAEGELEEHPIKKLSKDSSVKEIKDTMKKHLDLEELNKVSKKKHGKTFNSLKKNELTSVLTHFKKKV